jgi:hypothetical protein
MTDTPEKRIKRKLTQTLKQERVWYFFPAANGMGRAGIPDVICIVEGQFVGVECKADKTKKPTALQLECGKKIKDAGGHWFLVYDDASIAEVEQWIKTQKNRRQYVGSREGKSSSIEAK